MGAGIINASARISFGTMMLMITVYGIPNCDTVKKARAWLAGHGCSHTFHDFKKSGLAADQVAAWIQSVGWQKLLNRQGTIWRKLDPALQDAVRDAASAQALMLSQPSIVKRPVVDWGHAITVGFDAGDWQTRVTGAIQADSEGFDR